MELYKEIEKSFPKIEKLFTNEELFVFKNTPKNDLYLYHLSLGLWIRNNLLYPQKNIIYALFLKNGVKHPDDMSSLIINKFHDYLSMKI